MRARQIDSYIEGRNVIASTIVWLDLRLLWLTRVSTVDKSFTSHPSPIFVPSIFCALFSFYLYLFSLLFLSFLHLIHASDLRYLHHPERAVVIITQEIDLASIMAICSLTCQGSKIVALENC